MKKILLLALLSAFSLSAQTPSDYVTELPDASGIAFDSNGNLYIADYSTKKIIKVTPGLVQTTFASADITPKQIAIDTNDNLWITEANENKVTKITAGGVATGYAASGTPYGIVIDATGNVFYSELNSGYIKKISTTGTVSTFFYDPTTLKFPTGIIFDKAGNLIVGDYMDEFLKKINPAGVLTKTTYSLKEKITQKFFAFASNGDLYISSGQTISRLAAADGNLTLFYDFGANCPIQGITIYNGNLYASIYDRNGVKNKECKVVKIPVQTLGIENKPAAESIRVYPNPAIDYLYVESKNEVVKTIELYDMTGRLVKSYKPLDVKGNKIALPGLTSGNYILKINNTSKKIIIN
ncbi:T9SS type A sorting domain-containing protein [Flavobacterium sp. N502536]|uniref:virginiamycin B lyase family protein n=1 Tax=Flavobacterium sp. N502536 TaxID=2986837 RepID=UPI00222168CA|nr:T9SS type A sorting domain-containing protein [Flavobacterium sp. N502536]